MTAVLDAVATATAAVPRLKPLGEKPDLDANDKVIYPYGSFTAALGRADAYTLNVAHGMRHGRVIFQTFGRTADSALSLMDQVTARLLDVSLTIAGFDASPCHIELDPTVVRDPDDNGVIGVTATFTFTAFKES